MSESSEDIPEIQIEEVLTDAASAPGGEAEIEIDIDFDSDDDEEVEVGPEIDMPEDGVLVDISSTEQMPALAVDGMAPKSAAPLAGGFEYEPQFEIDMEVQSIPVGTHSSDVPDDDSLHALGAHVAPDPALEAGEAPVLDLDVLVPPETSTERTSTIEMTSDGEIDMGDDSLDPAVTPVIPSAFEEAEPQPVRQPAVAPPNTDALDLDAMLSELDLGIDKKPQSDEGQTEPEVEATREPEPVAESEPAAESTPEAPLDDEAEAIQLDLAADGESMEAQVLPTAPELEEEAADAPPPLEESVASAAEAAKAAESEPPPEFDEMKDAHVEAPSLPLGDDEPPAISSIASEELAPNAATMALLQKLAGAGADPEAMRAALHAVFKGEEYNAKALPDARAMLIGVARVLVATGFSVNEMVDAIIDAASE